MLGFGLIMGLFGLGATLVMTGGEETGQTSEDEDVIGGETDTEEVGMMPLEDILPDDPASEDADADDLAAADETQTAPASTQEELATTQESTVGGDDLGAGGGETGFDPATEIEGADDPTAEEPVADYRVQAGGPGETLTGQLGEDRFEVTLGGPDAPATVIECFDCDGSDDAASLSADEMLDTIWFRGDDGELLSQEELLQKDFLVQENEEIDGISLVFADHQEVYLPGMQLDDFVDNSLVIGNFGLQVA